MIVGKLGDATTVIMKVLGWVETGIITPTHVPYTVVEYGADEARKVLTYAIPLGTQVGTKIKVGFWVYLEYNTSHISSAWNALQALASPMGAMRREKMDTQEYIWDLTITDNGFVIDNKRPGPNGYDSDTLKLLDPVLDQRSSDATHEAQITIQQTVVPTNLQGGSLQVGFTTPKGLPGAGASYTPAPLISDSRASSSLLTLVFKDQRPKPAPVREVPIQLPPDVLYAYIGPYPWNETPLGPYPQLKSTPRDQINAWLNAIMFRDDCKELKAAIEFPKTASDPPMIKIIGSADGSGTLDANAVVSKERARFVQEAMLDRFGRGAGGAAASIEWSSNGANGPAGPFANVKDPKLRYAIITVDKDQALKVIAQVRKSN